MATNTLTFTKNALGRYESKFVATGEKVVVQIEKEKADSFTVYANIPGMTPVPVLPAGTLVSRNVIFELDLASGLEVTIECMSEVTDGKILGR